MSALLVKNNGNPLDKGEYSVVMEPTLPPQTLKLVSIGQFGGLYNIEEATSGFGVAKIVDYYWQNRWDEKGYEGLLPKFGAVKTQEARKQWKTKSK
jgi:hypothetical protein